MLLDGVDVRELRQNSLRSAIAVVPQGTRCFLAEVTCRCMLQQILSIRVSTVLAS